MLSDVESHRQKMALKPGVNPETKTPLKSVAPANPHSTQTPPTGPIVDVLFEGLNGQEKATIDLNRFSLKRIRQYNRDLAATDQLPEAERSDAIDDIVLELVLEGTTECSAFPDLTKEAVLDANYKVGVNYTNEVRAVIFPTSKPQPVES